MESARKRRRGPQPVFDGFGAVNRALAALRDVPETLHVRYIFRFHDMTLR